MASIVVHFCKGESSGETLPGDSDYPVPNGSTVRTEKITIAATTTPGSLSAQNDEEYIVVKAGAACWIKVGASPVAVDGQGWHLFAEEKLDLRIKSGEGVAVIEGTGIA